MYGVPKGSWGNILPLYSLLTKSSEFTSNAFACYHKSFAFLLNRYTSLFDLTDFPIFIHWPNILQYLAHEITMSSSHQVQHSISIADIELKITSGQYIIFFFMHFHNFATEANHCILHAWQLSGSENRTTTITLLTAVLSALNRFKPFYSSHLDTSA